MFPSKVFQAAELADNSLVILPIPLLIVLKADCPIPVSIPKPRPLVILSFKPVAAAFAFSKAEVKPLSVALNIAFTLKLSGILLLLSPNIFF